MKFINYLTSIAGIDIYPLISLMIFFLFFTGLIIYAIKADKGFIAEMKQLPLENTNSNDSTHFKHLNK
jgi:Ni,Fe-hydrogenase I cytochrome b subunit